MVYVTAVHMSGGTQHKHIEEVRWRNPFDNATGKSSVSTMVDFIEKNATGAAQVEGPPAANIGVNETASGRKYIQTFADRTWTNNLLSLPRY